MAVDRETPDEVARPFQAQSRPLNEYAIDVFLLRAVSGQPVARPFGFSRPVEVGPVRGRHLVVVRAAGPVVDHAPAVADEVPRLRYWLLIGA